MTMNLKSTAAIGLWLICCAGLTETYGAAWGTIRGLVKDGQGNPLVGAAIVILVTSEGEVAEKIVKRASTDDEGKFIARGIIPGRYRIKAEATGFTPVELDAQVKANKVTVFDSILLRREGTLAEQTRLNPDPKYAARTVRGTVFHVDEPDRKADDSVVLADRTPETHGFVHAFSQSAPGLSGGSFVGSNFAVSQQVAGAANVVISGQVGLGAGAPQRLETLTTASSGNHRLAVALGYGRFTLSRRAPQDAVSQVSLSATDTWQVSGPVLVIYGGNFSRFSDGSGGTTFLPRFGIAVDVGPGTRLYGGLTPGSSLDSQTRVNLESGEITFSEPRPLPLNPVGEPIADRSYRLEFGGQQVLSDNSSIEMMAFFDTISGHGVGLLAVPTEGPPEAPRFQTTDLNGRSRGLRVVYRRRLNSVVEGALGYALGEGQRLNSAGFTDFAHLFRNEVFQLVSARVDATFVGTGTRVSTVLRLGPSRAVFAIDPFQGQIDTYDPNLSVLLTQDLPSFALVPGQWALVVDVRNLFDQQDSTGDEFQQLIASRFQRLVRLGVSVRF